MLRGRGLLARVLVCAALGVMSILSWGQSAYPTRPIRIVAPEVGGGSDFLARTLATALSASVGKTVVVDNRGFSAGEIVARSQPDGYTLLLFGSPLWLSQFLRQNVPFDPVKDFAPIAVIATTPNVLVVHPSVKAATVSDLVAAAKAAPGQLNYASGSSGSTQHLARELFNVMAGTHIVRVPYRGSGPALNAVIAGEAQVMFPSAGAAAPHIKSGRIRALAVTSPEASILLPGLPTVSASGIPGYESTSPFGLFAPANTPRALIERLNREVLLVLKGTEIRERLLHAGVEPVGSPPNVLAATVSSEMKKWGALIAKLRLRE